MNWHYWHYSLWGVVYKEGDIGMWEIKDGGHSRNYNGIYFLVVAWLILSLRAYCLVLSLS